MFTRSGGTWTAVQDVIASDGSAGDSFGNSVALEHETAVVGAFRDTVGGQINQGSAYVFGPSVPTEVGIDIAPGRLPNTINPKSNRVIPVAILSTGSFDASSVIPSSAAFGPSGAPAVHGGHIEDVDGNGILDLVLHFKTQETGIACGDTSSTLTGETFLGEAIEGSDSVVIRGCRSAKKKEKTKKASKAKKAKR